MPLPALTTPAPPAPAPVLDDEPAVTIDSMKQLMKMSQADLEQVYRGAHVGEVPTGYLRGKPIFFPGSGLAAPVGACSRMLWQGKVIDPATCTMRNKLCGCKVVPAKVFYGESWMDGNPAIIMDYAETSRLAAKVRDEFRQVAPGLYLGVTYLRAEHQPKFGIFFVLECSSRDKKGRSHDEVGPLP